MAGGPPSSHLGARGSQGTAARGSVLETQFPEWAGGGAAQAVVMYSEASLTGAWGSFGSVPITASGGRYRLCWCAGGFLCDRVDELNLVEVSVAVIHRRLLADSCRRERSPVGVL